MIGDNDTFGIDQSFYLPDDHNSTLLKYSLNSINFSIIHINCHSILTNFDGISALLNSLNFQFSVIGVTETWLKDNSLLCNIQGFSFLHNSRAERRGGGVGVFIRENLIHKHRGDLDINNGVIESIFIEIENGIRT